jgi:CBS domain-containing protein
MKISDVIHGQKLVTARMSTPAGEIADLMRSHHVTGIPIVDDWGVLAGLVTSSMVMDLARAWAPRPGELPLDPDWHGSSERSFAFPWTKLKAEDVMTSNLCTVMGDDDLAAAAKAMMHRGVHRAVVLGKDRNVAGVLSSLDFVRLAAEGKLTG